MLAVVLLSPLDVRLEPGFLADRLGHFFSPTVLTTGDMVDAVRNVLLLAGWGLLEVLTDSGRIGSRRIRAALIGGAAIGLSAELAQLALPDRIPSLLDTAMNASGAALGALITHLSLRAVSRRSDSPTEIGVPALALAVPYAGVVLVETTFPAFRPVSAELMSGGPVERALWVFRNFSMDSIAVIPAIEFLLFLPAGYLLGLACAEQMSWEDPLKNRVFRRAAVAGLGIALVGELVRAPLGMPVQLGPFVVHSAALSVGALTAVRPVAAWSSDGKTGPSPRQFLIGYSLVLALWRLRPLVPHLDPAAIAGELTGSQWSPLFILNTRGDLYSAADILRTFLLFVPLGAVLGAERVRNGRARARSDGRAIAWILALAVVLELGQALIAGRVFDGTDLVVMAAGGVVAWTVVRRAEADRRE